MLSSLQWVERIVFYLQGQIHCFLNKFVFLLTHCKRHRFNQVLQYEYAAKYLENIGANPTKDNVEFVLNNLAIKDALVLPVWAREKIVIIPGMEGKLAEYQHALIDAGWVLLLFVSLLLLNFIH